MLIMVNVSRSINKYLISETFLYHLTMMVNIFEKIISPLTQQCFVRSRELYKIAFEENLILCSSKRNALSRFYQILYLDKFSQKFFCEILRIFRKLTKIYEVRIYWISDSQKLIFKKKLFDFFYCYSFFCKFLIRQNKLTKNLKFLRIFVLAKISPDKVPSGFSREPGRIFTYLYFQFINQKWCRTWIAKSKTTVSHQIKSEMKEPGISLLSILNSKHINNRNPSCPHFFICHCFPSSNTCKIEIV